APEGGAPDPRFAVRAVELLERGLRRGALRRRSPRDPRARRPAPDLLLRGADRAGDRELARDPARRGREASRPRGTARARAGEREDRPAARRRNPARSLDPAGASEGGRDDDGLPPPEDGGPASVRRDRATPRAALAADRRTERRRVGARARDRRARRTGCDLPLEPARARRN